MNTINTDTDTNHMSQDTPPLKWFDGLAAVFKETVSILHTSVPRQTTAVHEPSSKYYQLLGLHGRRWLKWRKIGIWVDDHQILPVLAVWRWFKHLDLGTTLANNCFYPRTPGKKSMQVAVNYIGDFLEKKHQIMLSFVERS